MKYLILVEQKHGIFGLRCGRQHHAAEIWPTNCTRSASASASHDANAQRE